MTRILVTGSTEGLGRAAAETLLDDGHAVVVHARNASRRAALDDLADRGADVVVGDLADPAATRDLAAQVNRVGRMDAVIHNAGTMARRDALAVNVVAPYLLTALVERPDRIVFLSSSMHRGGRADVAALEGSRPDVSYSDSKLLVTAFAVALARLWPDVLSNAVDPGWVPTRMGGPSAPDDLRAGHLTQTWLAVGDDPEARTTGGYWHHRRLVDPDPAVHDVAFQDRLVLALAAHTGTPLGVT